MTHIVSFYQLGIVLGDRKSKLVATDSKQLLPVHEVAKVPASVKTIFMTNWLLPTVRFLKLKGHGPSVYGSLVGASEQGWSERNVQ